jgi:hypothetical protein
MQEDNTFSNGGRSTGRRAPLASFSKKARRQIESVESEAGESIFPSLPRGWETHEMLPVPGVTDNELAGFIVGGNMLEGAYICDGDLITVHLTSKVANNDLVIAQPRGCAPVVKFFYREPTGRIRLEARHPDCLPLYYAPDEIRIIGRVHRVTRDLK